ncbi:hypothetical protein VPHK469_0233 [Vibrio phage K469]
MSTAHELSQAISLAIEDIKRGSSKVNASTAFIEKVITSDKNTDVVNPVDGSTTPSLQKLIESIRVSSITPVLQPRQVGDGTKVKFNTPATTLVSPLTLLVQLNGVTQRPVDDYTVTEIGSINFTTAPGRNVLIDVLFLKHNISAPTSQSQKGMVQGGGQKTATIVVPNVYQTDSFHDIQFHLATRKNTVGAVSVAYEASCNLISKVGTDTVLVSKTRETLTASQFSSAPVFTTSKGTGGAMNITVTWTPTDSDANGGWVLKFI